ncbi:ligand-gated channel protein [Paenalcaligenes hominis]|uniref:ligand-gated channel protein n=1 Tax=Paenalcaligenes hominis TaxID=643674 RepID=UPI003524EC69
MNSHLSHRGWRLSTLCLALSAAIPLAHAQNKSENAVSQLQNIVVTASGFEQLVEDAPASISVIPREELEKKAYRDVTDALRDVPGVVVTGGGSSSDISIRGMAAGYTLILIDGKRVNSRETRPNSDNAGIEQGWLPPIEAIDRIEVVRGPMSSLYGSEAMGGVVNIITRKIADTWTGSLRTEATLQQHSESGDIYQGNFYVAGPIKEGLLGVQISGQKSRRNEDKFLQGFNKQDTQSGNIKFTLTPSENHDLIAEVGRTDQKRISTPGKTIALETCGRNGCTPNEASESKYTRDSYALTHKGRYGNLQSESYIQQDRNKNPGRNMFIKNTELNSQWNTMLGNHHVTFGAQYLSEKLEDHGNQYKPEVSDLSRYQWAAYAEDEWELHPSFSLTSGLRLTHDENYGNHWTPRLYGVWHASDELSVKAGVSTGFKAPSLRAAVADWGQITGGGGGVPAVIVGNPDLKPEKSISQEIGFIWDNRENLNLGLTFFNTQFKDKISEVRRCTDPDGLPTCHVTPGDQGYKFISDRVNVDKAVMRGIEAVASWNITDDLLLSSNYTFTHSKQKSGDFSGRPLNKMPKHMFNTTLDWDYSPELNLWTRVNFRGKSSDYLSRTSMSEGTPSFTFVDMGLGYKISKNTNVGVGIYNVFDKRVTNETHGAVYDGRRYWAQLTVGF